MKKSVQYSFLIILIVFISFASCKKELSCEGCTDNNNNKPPIAVAGPDQVITLPADSVSLDGRSSSDPDGMISAWLWTKISGPASFNIGNPSDSTTRVKVLVTGTYQFELTVTDNGGLSAKDTMQILVNASGNSTSSFVFGCNATMISFGHLSQAGIGRIVSAGSKIFFSGYISNGVNNNVTDIYDTITQTWSTSNQLFGDINLGTKLLSSTYTYPIDQQMFEIYDASTGSRTTYATPEARAFISHTVVDNKIVFAGGFNPDSPYTASSKRLDIYDAVANSWSLVNFTNARGGMAVESLENKIFFAGGYEKRYDSLVQSCDDDGNNCVMVPAIVPVSRIDIYDLSTNSWSVANLSEPRSGITTAVVGNKILFAGGVSGNPTRVDIYDASSNNWSTAQVSAPVYDEPRKKRAHVAGNKVLFTRLWSKIVDIYDAGNNSWSTAEMSQPNGQTDYLVAIKGNKIVFFTVFDLEDISKNIDIYDASINTWCHALLNRSLVRSGIIASGNKIYIAGGFAKSNPNGVYDQIIDDIWILDF
jgi:N-acetylneuraminic acid mutarotase